MFVYDIFIQMTLDDGTRGCWRRGSGPISLFPVMGNGWLRFALPPQWTRWTVDGVIGVNDGGWRLFGGRKRLLLERIRRSIILSRSVSIATRSCPSSRMAILSFCGRYSRRYGCWCYKLVVGSPLTGVGEIINALWQHLHSDIDYIVLWMNSKWFN